MENACWGTAGAIPLALDTPLGWHLRSARKSFSRRRGGAVWSTWRGRRWTAKEEEGMKRLPSVRAAPTALEPTAAPARERASTTARTRRRRSPLALLRRDHVMLLLILPGLVYFLLFHYVPLIGYVVAFEDYVPFIGFIDSPFVGLDNF